MSVTSSRPEGYVSIAEYLAENEVRSTPVHPDTVAAPRISLQAPQEWREIPREILPGAYCAWAKASEGATNWSDNVLIMVGRLDRPVDSATLLRCGYTDSRRMPEWQEIQSDASSCAGFPAVAALGKYRVEAHEYVAYTRYVLTDKAPAQYLIQVTATVRADSPTAVADIGMIMSGLSVAVSEAREVPSEGVQANAPVKPQGGPKAVTTADVRGIGIALEPSGFLHSLTIDVHAFAKGPDALAASIVAAYQQAAAALPATQTTRPDTAAPDPSAWRAPAAGDDWPPDNRPDRPANYAPAVEQPYPWQQPLHRSAPNGPAQSPHHLRPPPSYGWR
ncbi:LpqN/LpqT family lipoprotein [Nocardia flavorosea]|uniref:LpqN/LpqT family lipoprotein n=1 Tax=Nocardia flavorosea TaxID=53429 RepID=UPI002454CDAF|nr:LpqN/LpqT family lipoprotein [Nocardia flavorosea]